MSRGSSGKWFDRRMAAERRVENSESMLKASLKAHAMVKAEKQSDLRVENKRRERMRNLRDAEVKQSEMLEQKYRQKVEQNHLNAQQDALCQELQRRRSKEASEQARVRRIAEQSEELRDLQRRLQTAQISKERAEQVEAIKERKRIEAEVERIRSIEIDQMRKQADHDDLVAKTRQTIEYKAELDQQMEYRLDEKRKAYQSFLEEKSQIDAVVAGVVAEEAEARSARQHKREALREMMRRHDAERREIKQRMRDDEVKERQKIEEWTKVQAERLAKIEAKKAERAKAEAVKYRRVADGMDMARKEQEETEQLLIELFIAEADKKIEEAAKAREERRLRMKQEMMEANRVQQVHRAERERLEKEEEEAMCKQMMEKFAEDDRLEQLNAQRRRMRKEEHRREVERLLQQRRAMYEEKRAAELGEREDELRQEHERVLVVEKERERMLREYACKLRDYLPHGVIRNEQDRAIVFGRTGEHKDCDFPPGQQQREAGETPLLQQQQQMSG